MLFIDGTYSVNKVEMPLYCFMIEDGFSNGQAVYYATGRHHPFTKHDGFFKDCNPAWCETKVIIIEKDFGEWTALKITFSNATILFANFTLSNTFSRKWLTLMCQKKNEM